MTRFKWFASEMPAPADDGLVVRLVRLAAWVVTGIGLTIGVLLALETPIKPDHVGLHFALAALGGVVLALSHRHRHQASAQWMVWGCWLIITLVTARNGGVRGPNLLNYPVLIVCSGWVLGSRPTLFLTSLTGAVLLLFVWADGRGWFPPADYGNQWAYTAYLAGILLLTCTVTLLSRGSYLRKLARSRRATADLAAREVELRKLHLAVEQNPESILITDVHARIEYVNEAFVRNTGYTRAEVLGRNPSMLSAGKTPAHVHQALWETLGQGKTWRGEFLSRRKDGSEFVESVVIAPIRQLDGVITHYVESKRDITDARRAEDRIHHLVQYDALTGLPNRTQLIERTDQAMVQALNRQHQLGLLLFNVDRFKNVNDVRGAEVGDRLLLEIAARLKALLRAGDMLARVGADEFVVLLGDLGADAVTASRHAQAMAHRIHTDLLRPVRCGPEEEVAVTASLGIALAPLSIHDGAAELLRRANTALHQAKQGGSGQTAFFESGMDTSAQRRFRIERELRQAIAGGALRLYLQPQVDIHRQVVGAEALVRWQHPDQGLVPPDQFIPVAEESDLIVQLDRWVFGQACARIAEQAAEGRRLHLSINLSPRHFRQPDFVAWFKDLLARSGADPRLLTLEVTEGLVIDDVDEAIARMTEVARWGVHFSIDDFGTGYSSLAYLKRLPINEIKIDKSFVQDAPTNAGDAILVETILAVAQHMALNVVAEGVENEAQAGFLAARHAQVIYQGYLFGKPEPAEQWLQRWSHGPVHAQGVKLDP